MGQQRSSPIKTNQNNHFGSYHMDALIKSIFEAARAESPSLIIIDDIDSICRKRNSCETEDERRMKTEFLKQMDAILHENEDEDANVFVLATTNLPWELDIAALRRFEKRILVGLPD